MIARSSARSTTSARSAAVGLVALALASTSCASKSPPAEPTPIPWSIEHPFDEDLDALREAPCAELVETPTSTMSSAAAAVVAEALLRRCELPPGDDVDALILRDATRAAELFFRVLPPMQPQTAAVYPFLDDPDARGRARRLFARFVAHGADRGEKDGREALSEWVGDRALFHRLGLTCAELRALGPDAGAAVELWLELAAAARCDDRDAIDPLKAALRGNSSARAAACRRLADASLGLEPEMLRAVLDDYGEHRREFKGSVQAGPFVIPTRSTIVASQYPGRDACLAVLERTHALLVARTVVDSPNVTITAIYLGRPQTIVVYTADRGGAATPGYVASSDPKGVPPALAAEVEGAWPRRRRPTPLPVRPLDGASASIDDLGAFSDAAGPHQWDLTLPRSPLPERIVVVVVDRDGTVRRHFDR